MTSDNDRGASAGTDQTAKSKKERPRSDERPFFATAAKGTEGMLRDELRELRVPAVRADRGGVHFGGDLAHAMRVCLRSRIALRVLWRVAEFACYSDDALYEGVGAVDWSRWLDAGRTLSVTANIKNSSLTHSGFVAQRVKDAIVDQLRRRDGDRPDVDRSNADVVVVVHLVKNRAQLSVDLAGTSLSRRGWRTQSGPAPLAEHLAASILRFVGFTPGTPFFDPMCGCGTFPIEAASIAAGKLPRAGLRFGFTRWRCFDASAEEAWKEELGHAKRFADPVRTRIEGSDWDPKVLQFAVENAERAGVRVGFFERELRGLHDVPAGSLVVLNPPYDVRIESDGSWERDLGDVLDRFVDSTVSVITPDLDLPRVVGWRADREHTLFNGDIECRLFTWFAQ